MKFNNYIKSPMNYTGGKFKLLDQILPLIPVGTSKNKFIDLFCGGGNVVANIHGYEKIACDCITQLIEIYKKFQSTPTKDIINYMYKTIDEYCLSMTNKDAYLYFRTYYNTCLKKNPLDLFILICYAFNNQIRFNSKGEFNMPFGEDRSDFNSSIKKNLIDFCKAIKHVSFYNKDFRLLDINELKHGDYVYCDPPYLITCASYNEQDGWTDKDEYDLLNMLNELDKHDIYFGLSNVISNKGKTNEILKTWTENNSFIVHHLNYSYSNCSYHTNETANDTDEVFITNYKPSDNEKDNEISLF